MASMAATSRPRSCSPPIRDLVRREKIADFRPATYAMERDYTYLRADLPAGFGWMTQDLHASGAVGDATLATAEKGEAALEHGARAFVALLEDVEKFDLQPLAQVRWGKNDGGDTTAIGGDT